MEPKLSFTIPSIHDDTTLDCRIYYSLTAPTESHHGAYRARGAIIAHPYAPLGGSYDDPVVGLIISEILKASFGFVCTFNFRGAYGSSGHTSWTGKAERADFISVAGFLVEYLQHCEHSGHSDSGLFSEEPEIRAIQIVFGGYSYGSWICSHLPEPPEIWKQFQTAIEGSAVAEIKARALHLATQANDELRLSRQKQKAKHGHTLTVGGEETSPEKRRRSGEHRFSSDIRRSLDLPRRLATLKRKSHNVQTNQMVDGAANTTLNDTSEPAVRIDAAYLLVSPLLPPISSFTALPLGIGALKSHDDEYRAKLSANPSLAIFGNDDMFTSAKKLRKWAQDISNGPSSRFRFVEVENAGHFWRSHTVQTELRMAVGDWIRGLDSAAGTIESEMASRPLN